MIIIFIAINNAFLLHLLTLMKPASIEIEE